MKKLIRKLPPKVVTAMLAASGLLLLSGSVGGTRAALTYYSDTYSSRLSTQNIGVTLLENGKEVSWRDYDADGEWKEEKGELLTEMLTLEDGSKEELKIGKRYTEELKVRNTGDIGEYVRVSIYKYWVDENGNKVSAAAVDPEEEKTEDDDPDTSDDTKTDINIKNRTLDPSVIKLELVNTNVWQEDASARTDERTVLYYTDVLSPGDETLPFTGSLMIDQKIVKMVSETVTKNGDITTIKSTYDYDGKQFRLEVEVDAVQEHNAEDAALSAWGRSVTLNGGSLTVND